MSSEVIVKTSVRMPKHIHKQLKQYCLDVEKSEVEVINQAIIEYLGNHSRKRQ